MDDLFAPFRPHENWKGKIPPPPLSAVETRRYKSRSHLWLHLTFLICCWREVFMTARDAPFQSYAPAVISHFLMWIRLLRLGVCLLPLIQVYAAFVSDLFLFLKCASGLFTVNSFIPPSTHHQVWKQCVHKHAHTYTYALLSFQFLSSNTFWHWIWTY